jgi:hypothetical protein
MPSARTYPRESGGSRSNTRCTLRRSRLRRTSAGEIQSCDGRNQGDICAPPPAATDWARNGGELLRVEGVDYQLADFLSGTRRNSRAFFFTDATRRLIR